MMVIKFTEQEKKDIRDIIEEYRTVSDELLSYQKKAEEIKEKVTSLQSDLKSIKEREDKTMAELHEKYGEFSLQDIYESII